MSRDPRAYYEDGREPDPWVAGCPDAPAPVVPIEPTPMPVPAIGGRVRLEDDRD